MNIENDIKEFGFCHISINAVYNVRQLAAIRWNNSLLDILNTHSIFPKALHL